MRLKLLTMEVRYEHDVVLARQRARTIAAALKFDVQAQTRIATAVSEVVRNAFQYAGGGSIDFEIENGAEKNAADHCPRQRTGHSESGRDPRRQVCFEDRHGAGHDWRQAAAGSFPGGDRQRVLERSWCSARSFPIKFTRLSDAELNRCWRPSSASHPRILMKSCSSRTKN